MPTSPNISAGTAISRVRRDAVIAWTLRVLLAAAIAAALVLTSIGKGTIGGSITLAVCATLFVLGGRSVRNQRDIAGVGALIDNGQLDEAETALAKNMQTVLLHRGPRIGLLQNLAALRHAQRRYREAGQLASELLKYVRTESTHRRTLQFMLAECALEAGDLPTVHTALSQIRPGMPVREMLKLMELQTTYCARSGNWAQALDQLPLKIEYCELLPSDIAARVQAMLAVAALKTNRPEWHAWLKRRVELLTDPVRLIAQYPYLREL